MLRMPMLLDGRNEHCIGLHINRSTRSNGLPTDGTNVWGVSAIANAIFFLAHSWPTLSENPVPPLSVGSSSSISRSAAVQPIL